MLPFFKRLAFFGLIFIFVGLISLPASALDVGTTEVNSAINLGSESPIVVVARVINIAMIFLGAMAVTLMIYAGFKWMTAAGNEDNVEQAKRTFKNGLIGLVIILSSWGVVSFVLGKFFGVPGQLGSPIARNNNGDDFGFGALGNCAVSDLYPAPGQKDIARNTSIILSFQETINPNFCNGGNLCDGSSFVDADIIKVFETSLGDDATTNVANIYGKVVNDKILVLTPENYLGSPSATAWYSARVESGMKKTNGDPLFSECLSNYLAWQFEVSSKLDLTPPQIITNSLFPTPDNYQDDASNSVGPKFASGSLTLSSLPNYYKTPVVSSVTKNPSSAPWNSATADADSNFAETSNSFTVTIVAPNKAQLYKGTLALGIVNMEADNSFNFPNYFRLKIAGDGMVAQGDSWIVSVTGSQAADWIKIGSDTYTFVNASSSGLDVKVLSGIDSQVAELALALSGRNDINVTATNNKIDIIAKDAGSGPNSIEISASGSFVSIFPIQGGSDAIESVTINDKQDKPMNSLIQTTFNEPISPVTVSGKASEVYQTVRVVNASVGAKSSGQSCSTDSDCLSYNCNFSVCTNNYLSGDFSLSNGYKTLEFKSDNECGVNGCGEKIYCLPAGSHLKMEVVAAPSSICTAASDCSALSPYTSCSALISGSAEAEYGSCNNGDESYSLSEISKNFGVMDNALNSFDGNHDSMVWGPMTISANRTFYDDNLANANYGDNARWSFFINNKIESDPPIISAVSPVASSLVNLSKVVKITFNKLMSADAMRSGSLKIGTDTHRLINLYSKSSNSIGYWIDFINIDSNADGEADYTVASINHSMFAEGLTYRSQVGSGVKDIYQNCFKPSTGPGCTASDINPSCCLGSATAVLGDDGNCQ